MDDLPRKQVQEIATRVKTRQDLIKFLDFWLVFAESYKTPTGEHFESYRTFCDECLYLANAAESVGLNGLRIENVVEFLAYEAFLEFENNERKDRM